jgi:hypothetical protein
MMAAIRDLRALCVCIFLIYPFCALSSDDQFVAAFSPRSNSEQARLDPKKPEDLIKLLQLIAESQLGKPYANGPLGESGFDPIDSDPLYRLDKFDCTTFIETVMANAYCHGKKNQLNQCISVQMRKIRYEQGKISFKTRKHITEFDWLPQNIRGGYLVDVNKLAFADLATKIEVEFDRDLWLANTLKEAQPLRKTKKIVLNFIPISVFFSPTQLDASIKQQLDKELAQQIEKTKLLPPEEAQKQKFRAEMDYLKKTMTPIEENLRRIPSGSILNLVRGKLATQNRDTKTETAITHQGLIFQKTDTAYIIHAAANVGHVSVQKLSDYLLRYLKSSKAKGISVYQIKNPKS